MLGLDPFYWGLLRKYYVLFASLFNEIRVPRYGTDGSIREYVRVPISLGAKDKTLAQVFSEPQADARQQAITLPRLSFDRSGMTYDATRHQSSTEYIMLQPNTTSYAKMYTPVPYDINFDLFVYSKTQEDGLKIVEQIIPFFTPDYTVRAELIDDFVTLNVPIILNQVTSADDYSQGSLVDRRAIIWTLSFTMKAYLFGPEHTTGIIKFVDVPLTVPQAGKDANGHYYTVDTTPANTAAIAEVTVQPGLLPNGQPTTNAAASIDYTLVNLGDDWAYAVTIKGDLDPDEGTGGANEPVTGI